MNFLFGHHLGGMNLDVGVQIAPGTAVTALRDLAASRHSDCTNRVLGFQVRNSSIILLDKALENQITAASGIE
jgi:hypothetical protein